MGLRDSWSFRALGLGGARSQDDYLVCMPCNNLTETQLRRHVGRISRDFPDGHGLRLTKFMGKDGVATVALWPAHGWFHRDFYYEQVCGGNTGNVIANLAIDFDARRMNPFRNNNFSEQTYKDLLAWGRSADPAAPVPGVLEPRPGG